MEEKAKGGEERGQERSSKGRKCVGVIQPHALPGDSSLIDSSKSEC